MKPSRSSLALLLLKLGVAQGQAVRVWAIDERLLQVHQPPASVPPACNRYEWGYLASALEIERRDEAFFVFLPCVSKETSAAFLQGLVATDPQSMQVVIQDKRGSTSRPASQTFLRTCDCSLCRRIVRNSTRWSALAT